MNPDLCASYTMKRRRGINVVVGTGSVMSFGCACFLQDNNVGIVIVKLFLDEEVTLVMLV